MLLLPSILLWLFAAVLEALAAWVLFDSHVFGMPVVIALFLHLLYAVALAGAGYLSLPKRYRRPVRAGLAYLFSAALFVPVLSWFGLLCALLPALHWPKRVESDDWQDIPQPDLPFRTVEVDPDAVYRRGGLATVLQHDTAEWRARALMATRYLADRDAVPILRVALRDPVDEVRLLAYSLLSSKERVIDQILDALRQAQEEMQAAGNAAELGRIEEQMATLDLEKAELGLVEGSVRQFVLKQALGHITTALRERITGSREFIHGRICLRIALADGEHEQIEAAEHAFAAAEQYGMGADKVAPYRAECAFERGAYELVPAQLQRLEPQARKIPRLAPVVEYWT